MKSADPGRNPGFHLRSDRGRCKEVLTLAFGAMIGWSRAMYALLVLSVGIVVLFMLFRPAALIWSYEWVIVAGRWVIGLGLLRFRIWSDR